MKASRSTEKSGVVFRQALAQRFPRLARIARTPDSDSAVNRRAKLIRLQRNDVGGIGAPGMRNQRKAELRGQSVGDIAP